MQRRGFVGGLIALALTPKLALPFAEARAKVLQPEAAKPELPWIFARPGRILLSEVAVRNVVGSAGILTATRFDANAAAVLRIHYSAFGMALWHGHPCGGIVATPEAPVLLDVSGGAEISICYETEYDGFWLTRISQQGVATHTPFNEPGGFDADDEENDD